ncbi:hypothetical protein Tco_1538460 [Tanacetum coccineum]
MFLPYTVIVLCLTNTEAIDSRPEASFAAQLLWSNVLASGAFALQRQVKCVNLIWRLMSWGCVVNVPNSVILSKLLLFVHAIVPSGPTRSVIRCLEKIILVRGTGCLKRVDNHTIPHSSVGTPMPEPTPEEIVASQPECKVVKKAKETNKRKASTKPQEPSVTTKKKKLNRKYLENSLDKVEEDGSELTLRTGKKVDPPVILFSTWHFHYSRECTASAGIDQTAEGVGAEEGPHAA